MKNDHIISLLEEKNIRSLSEAEARVIESHARACANCSDAYRAARLSEQLLRARMSESVEPSPFFKTRVLAAMREGRAAAEPAALARMWRAAWAMVSTMVAIVAILFTLNLTGGEPADESDQPEQPAILSFLPEPLLFGEDGELAADDLTSGDLLETVLAAEDAYGGD
jgi:hypothetical protein